MAQVEDSGTGSGTASPVTAAVVRSIEFPISNPTIGFGLKPPTASTNLRVIVTGGTGPVSLAARKRRPPKSTTSNVSGDVSSIVVGPVAVIDTESNVEVTGSKTKSPVSVSVPIGDVKVAVAPDNS